MKKIMDKLFETMMKVIIKKRSITAKGEMVRLYCRKISDDTWRKKDYVYDYENELGEIALAYDVTRKEAAKIVLSFFDTVDSTT